MKWTAHKNHATSDCGRYIVNWNDPRTQYMAVKLGTAWGNGKGWDGSAVLKVGTKSECVQACEGDAGELLQRD